MKLFRRKKKNRYPGEVFATQNGVAISLDEMPDEIIRTGILGDGLAILPTDGKVVSPVDGTITAIAVSKHAFCIETTDGLEVLVHIGVDSVALNGKGFNVLVKQGQYVLAGKLICEVDLEYLKQNKIPCHTAVLIPNHEELGGIKSSMGEVRAGKSTIIRY